MFARYASFWPKKIEYDFALDSPWTPETNVPNINPLGKIPVLLLDDETVLFDSRVIAEYLDNVAPNNKLMPAQNQNVRKSSAGKRSPTACAMPQR